MNAMHWSEERGTLTDDLDAFARILRTDRETAARVIGDLIERKICHAKSARTSLELRSEFLACHGNVTLISRRMVRDEEERNNARLRKQQQRQRDSEKSNVTDCHKNVTLALPVSVPVSVPEEDISAPKEPHSLEPKPKKSEQPDHCPYEAIRAAYNTQANLSAQNGLPGLIGCRKLLPADPLGRAVRLAWKASGEPALYELFRAAAQSPFCCGKGERQWRADLKFILKNQDRILSGFYGSQSTAQSQEDKRKAESIAFIQAHSVGGGNVR